MSSQASMKKKLKNVKPPKVLDEFRAFITKGNVVDMAVGVVIGLAFTAVVNGMVADIITPLISPAVHGHFNTWNETIPHTPITFAVGPFINTLISFVLIALVVFFLIVKPMGTMKARADAKKAKEPPTTKSCPYCISDIPITASRCKFCASDVDPGPVGKPPSGK